VNTRKSLEKIAAQVDKDRPTWFPKAILAGALLGATHGAIRPHSAFSGGIEQGKVTLKNRIAGGLVGSTVGAGIGWLPQIVYEGTRSNKNA